ncbi:MAG: lysophospholipase [Candidatus Obscuribacterales bacterium]|nr:lysophospholipase [Candidatus Obscuribacterales bacterium]
MRSKIICIHLIGLLSASFAWNQSPAAPGDMMPGMESKTQQELSTEPIKRIPEEGASDQKLRNPGFSPYPGFKAWIGKNTKPWCAVLCLHGLTLHKDSYARLANRLSSTGIATYAMDTRGFGDFRKIAGKDRIDFNGTFADVRQNLLYIRKAHPDLPVFLVGESMGGALALQSAAKNPELVDGVLSSVPHANARGGTILKAVLIGLKAVVKGPNTEIDIEQLARGITEKPKLERKIVDDPQVRTKLTIAELFRVKKMMKDNKKFAPSVTVQPLVIVQGWRDKLMKPKDSIDIMNKVGTPNKDLVVVGQSEHLILEEGQYTDYVLDALLSWFDKRSPQSPIKTPSELLHPEEVVHHHKPDEEVFRLLRSAQNYARTNDWAKAAELRDRAIDLAAKDRTPQELATWFNSLPPQLVAPLVGPGTEQLLVRSGLNISPTLNGTPVMVLFTDSRVTDKKLVFQKKLSDTYCTKANIVSVDIATEEGAMTAKTYGVLSAPSVLLLDKNRMVQDCRVSRSEKELKAILNRAAVAVATGQFIQL